MTTSIVATFPSLMEAEIACGALRASGFDARVLDVFLGALDPISGYRVAVPDDQCSGAQAALDQIRRDADRDS